MLESLGKKKVIIIGSSLIGGIILLIIIVYLINILKPHYVSYQEAEKKITEATKKYYDDNPTLLPVNDGDYTLQYSTLVEKEYIKPLDELLKDGSNCSANIIVNKTEEEYLYLPYLNCIGSYETKELYKTIINDNPITTNGNGLYLDANNNYYFRGDVVNNYIDFGYIDADDDTVVNLWRIIKIENDNTIKIISTERTKYGYPWDNRYNINEKRSYGYNDFEISRINDTLQNENAFSSLMTDDLNKYIVAKNWCIGKRSQTETDMSGNVECSVKTEKKLKIGLVSLYEILAASTDKNCINTLSKSCINYNYFNQLKISSWTLTGVTENSYHVYSFYKGKVSVSNGSYDKKVEPVVYLSKYALYSSGSGTQDDPYKVR